MEALCGVLIVVIALYWVFPSLLGRDIASAVKAYRKFMAE
jgi:hypothetical protein